MRCMCGGNLKVVENNYCVECDEDGHRITTGKVIEVADYEIGKRDRALTAIKEYMQCRFIGIGAMKRVDIDEMKEGILKFIKEVYE